VQLFGGMKSDNDDELTCQVLSLDEMHFPFEFGVPRGLPSSHAAGDGSVWYAVQARAYVDGAWSLDPRCKVPVHIVGDCVEAQLEKFRAPECVTKLSKFHFASGHCMTSLSLATRVVVPGQPVSFVVSIDNAVDTLSLQHVKIKCWREVVWHDEEGDTSRHKTSDVLANINHRQSTVPSDVGTGIGMSEISGSFIWPEFFDGVPSYRLDDLLEIRHLVTFDCHFSLTNDLELSMQVFSTLSRATEDLRLVTMQQHELTLDETMTKFILDECLEQAVRTLSPAYAQKATIVSSES